MTNLLAILHTTAAYQAAAVRLMMGEADFAARQLEIAEPGLRTTNELVEFHAQPPPLGVGGAIVTTNYIYSFEGGQLRGIRKLDWLKHVSPRVTNLLDLAQQPSQLDTNGALQLATQRLARLSVDVAELDRRWPRRVLQIPAGRTRVAGPRPRDGSDLILSPVFQISWGDRAPPMDAFNPIRMKILGTTKEPLELDFRDTSVSRRPLLVMTNAPELLGPLPPARHFVQELIGSEAAYRTVAGPDRLEACLLHQFSDEGKERLSPRTGPLLVPSGETKRLSALLVDFDSYAWTLQKACSPDYGVQLTFIREKQRVEVLICFECDWLAFKVGGREKGENFDFAHDELAKIVKELFPRDDRIQKLETETESRQRAENALKGFLPKTKP